MKWFWLAFPVVLFFLLLDADMTLFHASHIKAVETQVAEQVQSVVVPTPKLLFTGDVMLDRQVAVKAASEGFGPLFAGVAPLLKSEDAVIANLEGTITTNSSVATEDNLNFTFATTTAPLLKDIGVTAVSLSNNHSNNFGESGYEETKTYLHNAGILTFGSPDNTDEPSVSFISKGKTICLVGYEEFIQPDTAPFVDEIESLRPRCNYIVATIHAGVEYQATPTTHQQNVAHAFIDAGADAVIGTHPHVVEPLEIYKGKPIFYSLGNFMFDQNFSFETTHGLAIQIEPGQDKTTLTLIPVTIVGEQVSISDASSTQAVLETLTSGNLPAEIRANILATHTFTL